MRSSCSGPPGRCATVRTVVCSSAPETSPPSKMCTPVLHLLPAAGYGMRMEHVGIRDLRNQTASAVRRAGAGERTVITVDGRPVAQWGPLEATDDQPTLADLAARGWLMLPRRPDRPAPTARIDPWPGARLDRIVDEV